MSISCSGGTTWNWYLFTSCSLGLRERGDMGPVIDHLNYVRWGSVYISEMNQLPKKVLEEFKKGDFVVKWNENKFNQVSPDHSLE